MAARWTARIEQRAAQPEVYVLNAADAAPTAANNWDMCSAATDSDESFGGWITTFTGPRLCAANVDRLTFGGNIIETGTGSYRVARSRAAAGTDT
ncbi:hypothetical protein [Pseudonocardia acidicola]|uniref:hypothetical protein n=1 Tax=Pseudonocardia acidicola TaxID=2724939 RepID=UPI001B7D155B|nr:hypothetical protein [Pseudonocardia acidicola]